MTDGVFDITTGIDMSIAATDEDMRILASQLNALLDVLSSTQIN